MTFSRLLLDIPGASATRYGCSKVHRNTPKNDGVTEEEGRRTGRYIRRLASFAHSDVAFHQAFHYLQNNLPINACGSKNLRRNDYSCPYAAPTELIPGWRIGTKHPKDPSNAAHAFDRYNVKPVMSSRLPPHFIPFSRFATLV
ncbi:hypothetical protein KBD34_00310 [Patescibacteria group bacterium]|nr:hypothetical protein [Patescibacteria group bacterium]